MTEPYVNPMVATLRAITLFIRNILGSLVRRPEGKTSRVGVLLQLMGLAASLYGLFLWSPALAFVIGGGLAIMIGERL